MSSESGLTLVETALSSLVLISVLIGIAEMSLALYTYHFISDAAREGSRYAMVRGSSCLKLATCNATATQIQSYVDGLGFPGINPKKMTVSTSWLSASSTTPTTWTACASTCNAPGNQVQVQVQYAFPIGIPGIPAWTINMTSTSVMVISQ